MSTFTLLACAGLAYISAVTCATAGYGNPSSDDNPGCGYHDAKEAPENEAMREEQRRENEEEGL